MVIQGSICHKGRVNTAHKIELFVIQDFQEMEGQNAWVEGVEGERVPNTPKYID